MLFQMEHETIMEMAAVPGFHAHRAGRVQAVAYVQEALEQAGGGFDRCFLVLGSVVAWSSFFLIQK